MENTGRVNVDLAPIAARAMAFLNPDAVERFYALSPAKYYADAMRGAGKSSAAITAGRAEQQIVSAHALGILRAAEEATIRGLLRAVDRKTYDKTHEAIKSAPQDAEISLDACMIFDLNMDTLLYRTMLAFFQIFISGRQVVRNDSFGDLSHWLLSQSDIKTIRKEQPTANEKKALQAQLGKLPVRGFGDLYDRFDIADIDEFSMMYEGAGIDVTDYTADIRINADDASIILSDTPEKTALNAASLMVARAIQKDKAFCIDKILRGDAAALEAARIAQEKAEQRAAVAEKRIAELEAAIRQQEKDAQKSFAAIQAHEADAQELSALRDALWRSAQDDAQESTADTQSSRIIPDDVVVVGGHPAWARRLTERFPSIRAYPHGTTCPESVIRSASELWIQAAYMSHTEFYAVIDVARGCSISVHYFSGAGTTTAIDNLLK